ncbi:hypothetical protein Clacol_007007 [Clathrus columnatus]|uniref:DUF6534 domain-containing protein n=1 Tax=Clathrus columnatus TaxID=1419009 RepID=A0AAV5AGL5_9AGAM|nr:hypothetical protein Clacol_007007 [Clathrus columnatus]
MSDLGRSYCSKFFRLESLDFKLSQQGGLNDGYCVFWRLKEIFRLAEIEWLVGVKHGTVAAADIGIAVAQCWYLHFARTGVKKTDPLINALMVYSINRGVLTSAPPPTSIAAVADLACFLAMPDNFIWLAFNFVVSKLHANSLLATLNTRDAMRGRGNDTDLIETVTTIRIPTNPIETIGLQMNIPSSCDTNGAHVNADQFHQPKTGGSVSTSVDRLSSDRCSDVRVVNRRSIDEE